MQYLPSSYAPWVVAASLLIASFASFVALDLAKRVRTRDRGVALSWWIGGSLAMGTGIWCMHFVGMLAFSLPIPLGYTVGLTVASWIAGVAVSAIALFVASQGELNWRRLAGGAIAMGLGICAMHYTGMAALDMSPGIVWNPLLVAASALIAIGASAAALLIFFWLRKMGEKRGMIFQPLAALVMGIAICGMHYTGMAAASFPAGTVCLSADALAGPQLGMVVSVSSIALLAMTLFTSTLDARMRSSLKVANVKLETANEELRRRAFQDPLTGLPNRMLFEDRLAHALQRHARAGEQISERNAGKVAVLFVDLDGFKPINDSLGHAAGDAVLKEVAVRLSSAARDADTVARIGGDEFVLLMEDVSSLADCVSLARRLIEALAAPLEIGGRRVALSGSVGIAAYPDHGDGAKLVMHADAAMYTAKRAGGSTYALYETHMDEGAQEQLHLLNDLRLAIDQGQLQLHYQPKIDGQHGQIRGVEALLRWNHPERGLLNPGLFIPIAERFGLINSLGNWVIDEACRQMHAWAEIGLHMRVAINLSVHQLREEDLARRIEAALARNFVEPSQLLCEITESVAMEDIKSTQRAFEQLARIGVFLSIDDFGTGYSSLSYLRQLPARQLKIDRSFVCDVEGSADARAIVSAVIQLAHELGLRVVAEGVETQGQRDILLALHCDELQGYFLARPMAAATLEAWTEGRKPVGTADFSPSVLGGHLMMDGGAGATG
ncbi:diguanylate cyclase (GGDEF)-like protein [Pelomonas saccharophila]|uniref:Diguanylate cyclase (GGDEF)-like protein n=1 Tax=Roseateles saccharophilus TaxID=304 RepID=A0ABU1YUS8_ROSSA|nr:EAL domain-containing protein [Roseateles saccharophilus]MDR7272610.1 diguanylate cyclase (GGDEF)-like protein [Roseateles saccharophilus]